MTGGGREDRMTSDHEHWQEYEEGKGRVVVGGEGRVTNQEDQSEG